MKKIDLLVMKKWSFIFYSVLVMVVAGCSGDVAPIEPVHPDNVIDQEIYSDVPIEFGYGGMTKAPITEDDLRNGQDFYLFSIEDGVQDLTSSKELNIYNARMNYLSGYGFIFNNASYYYHKDTDTTYRFNSYSTLTTHLLKSEREIKARFYAYSAEVVQESGMKVKYNSTLGAYHGDILFSKAHMNVTTEGGNQETIDTFNASIVKENNKKPTFHYTHATAALMFRVTFSHNRDMSPYIIRVAGLRIKNSPSQADLCLVNLDEPSKEGTFDPESFVYSSQGAEWPKLQTNPGGSGALNFDIDSDFYSGQLSSGYMFIVPQKEPLKCIMHVMRVNKENPNANGHYYYEFELDPADYDPNLTSGHEAGMLYSYNIVLDWNSTFIDPKSVGPIVRNGKQVPATNWNTLQ